MSTLDYKRTNAWYEIAGHIVLAILPIDLLMWAREWTRVKLPWPFKGQWPPGRPIEVDGKWYSPLDRVADTGWDHLDAAIGHTIRSWVLIGLLIWKW